MGIVNAEDHRGPASTAQCPWPHEDPDQRKATQGEWRTGVGIERVGAAWHIGSLELSRQILRSHHTTQAGFNAEQVRANLSKARHPVLYADGAEHRKQRGMIARYFAPATVTSTYRQLMEGYARETLADLDRRGELDLGVAAMGYSVRVAAHIVGLDSSTPDAMGRRLMRLFGQDWDPGARPGNLREKAVLAARSTWASVPVILFTVRDVRPAVRARRENRREDVISHLLDQNYTLTEIATECLTYAAAGMVTTRQFIVMAAWHMLEDPQLRARFLAGSQEERYAILYEILRLEPVVGHLYRRATEDIEIEHEGRTHVIAAGELVVLSVKDVNVEAESFERPRQICPERVTPRGVRAEGMAFGEGAHRCPGNFVAIQESDIFLRNLFSRDVEQRSQPSLSHETLVAGYRVDGLRIGVRSVS